MKQKKISEGTFKITLANTVQYLVFALFYIIVTKTNTLTQTDIGTISILSFLVSIFSMLTLFALPTALTKFTSEKLGKNQKEEAAATLRTIIQTVAILSIAGFAVAVLFSQLISIQQWNNNLYLPLIILNFIYAFLINIKNLSHSILQSLYLFGKMATLIIVFSISSRVTAIILALLEMGVIGVIIGYMVGTMITLALAIKFLHGKLPKTTKSVPLKPILFYSFPLFLTSITGLIIQWAGIVIIASITNDLALTGIYSIVVQSANTFSILYLPVTTTIFPALSSHHGLKKPQNISNILRVTSRFLIFLLLPSCIGLAIIAPTALTFFYGSGYTKGAIALGILSITALAIALENLFMTTFQAIGKTEQILKISILTSILLIVMLLSFVPIIDITGAALAQLIVKAIAIFLSIHILKKEIKIHLDKNALWKSIVSTIATIPFLLAIELILSPRLSTVQTLALELLTAGAIYAFSIYSLKALKSRDFQLLKQALPKQLTKYINIIERFFIR